MGREKREQAAGRDGRSAWWARGGWVSAAALAVGLIVVSGMYIATPAEDLSEEADPPMAEAQAGSIGASMSLNVSAEWTVASVIANGASGVVTSNDVVAGGSVGIGEKIYSVDLNPVFVGVGSVPSFRAISEGTSGEDVAQLQQFLADSGFYFGAIDGEAGRGTKTAITQWQREQGLPVTGVMDSGNLLYVPTLPAQLRLDQSSLAVGSVLVGGEKSIQVLSAQPAFTIAVTDTQSSIIPDGASVELMPSDGTTWFGTIEGRNLSSGSTPVLKVGPRDGAQSVCTDTCSRVPQGSTSSMPGKITTKAEVSGIVVPSSSLITAVDGRVMVEDETGQRWPVTVIDSANGQSVVEGISAGQRVRLPVGGG